jgi:raffinose/stachyose/melibiose transport system substrate-binding protein
MKKIVLSVILVALVATGVFASGQSGRSSGQGSVYLLNFKPEIDQQWKEVAADFTKETGIQMKVVTAGAGTYEQTLRAEITKSAPPTLFNINGPVGYQNWADYTLDLKDSKIYSWLSDKSLAVSSGSGVYGIPYAVETYGIIYNDAILRKYFALPGKVVNISSADDIKDFATLKVVVEDIQKNRVALGIEGAFASTSFASGEAWRWQTHLLNLPVYYEYKDKKAGDLDQIAFTYAANFKNIFDLYINNSITDKKMLGAKTVGDSMAEFALGKVAFVQNGNWAWSQISGEQGNVVKSEDIKFLPIYTGVSGEATQGLCTGTENFICVNAKASSADREAAFKLLEWLFGTDNGKKNVVDKLGFVTPFNTFTASERPTDPLVKEMFRYLDNPSLTSVAWNFTTFPSEQFKLDLADELYEYCLGNTPWNSLVQGTINAWSQEKAASK